MEAADVVRALIDGWERRDLPAIMNCFADDAVWWNSPYPRVVGKSAIATSISNFLATVTSVRFEVHNFGAIGPNTIVNERNDIFTTTDGRVIDLPVMGIFEVVDGRITRWNDYFDAQGVNGRPQEQAP